MTSKISPETLVYLDFMEFINYKVPMPKSSIIYIEKHGIPDEITVVNRQRKLIADLGIKGIPTPKGIGGKEYADKIKRKVATYGNKSAEVVGLCKEARAAGVSWNNIARWSNNPDYWIRNRVQPSKQFLSFKRMFDEGYTINSPEAVNLVKKFVREGYSLTQIGKWTETSYYTIKKMLNLNTK